MKRRLSPQLFCGIWFRVGQERCNMRSLTDNEGRCGNVLNCRRALVQGSVIGCSILLQRIVSVKLGETPSIRQGPVLDGPQFISETDAVEHDKLCHDQITYQWFNQGCLAVI